MDLEKYHLSMAALMHDLLQLNIKDGIKLTPESLTQQFQAMYGFEQHKVIQILTSFYFPNEPADAQTKKLGTIMRMANGITEKAERRSEAHKAYPVNLISIFSNIYATTEKHRYPLKNFMTKPSIQYPELDVPWDGKSLKDIQHTLKMTLSENETVNPESFLNNLMVKIKNALRFVPSDFYQDTDISLADHLTLTTAISTSLYEYYKGQTEFVVSDDEVADKSYLTHDAFIFGSIDFSGIQRFIFDTPTDGALKNMRTRSFYLDMMGEVFTDQLLKALALTRANCIYVGGGHAYYLLPNTNHTKQTFEDLINQYNQYFFETYDNQLFMGHAMVVCNASSLVGLDESFKSNEGFLGIMANAFQSLSSSKNQKFNFQRLNQFNQRSTDPLRECHVCGKSDYLTRIKEQDTCSTCGQFIDFSSELMNDQKNIYVLTSTPIKNENPLVFPSLSGQNHLQALDQTTYLKYLEAQPENIVFTYIKNQPDTELQITSNLWIADAIVKNKDGYQASLGEIATKDNDAIERIAVFKMDVDSLGATFKDGFDPSMYTISRMSALSSQLSYFYKFHIKELMTDLNITIIFSGGDDAFMVGTLKDIVEFSHRIHQSFHTYTANRLHFSGAIGLFKGTYPFHMVAEYMESLVHAAKAMEGKNAICFLDENNVLKWLSFFESIGKTDAISEYKIIEKAIDQQLVSNTYLYNKLYIQYQNFDEYQQRMPYLLAYQLGRIKDNAQKDPLINELSHILFRSAHLQAKTERLKLIVAIQLFMYLNRNKTNQEEDSNV